MVGRSELISDEVRLLPSPFGTAFAGAIAPARILILAGFFMGMRRIFVVFLQSVGRPGRTVVGEAPKSLPS